MGREEMKERRHRAIMPWPTVENEKLLMMESPPMMEALPYRPPPLCCPPPPPSSSSLIPSPAISASSIPHRRSEEGTREDKSLL